MTPLAIPTLGVLALETRAFNHLRDTLEDGGPTSALLEWAEEWKALAAARPDSVKPRSSGTVAVIPIVGPMWQRSYWGAETPGIAAEVVRAAKDSSISAIVLEVDSPGGEVSGVTEAAAKIRAAARQKPIIAVANSQAASAAYWIASQATELWVTPSGEVGSIGVFGMHMDMSKMAEDAGVKASFVYAGEYKVEGNPYEPLSDEARGAMQARVNEAYGMFVRDVATGRGTTAEEVRSGFGRGRMVTARKAVEAGMADRVGTLEDAIRRAGTLGKERQAGLVGLAEAETDLLRLRLD